ncbi:retrotransposon protein, putative, ty1-copia subclass [Tanacetum coccineum]
MARKPYTHQVDRAKDLLGLIHTDVCGPFKIMSRQGANYFVTFTNDFSRYGYVYLLKHKHEVFETFKVFQKEVENQLGKTIKLLRSDRGGEYMSQEFLDHLKDHEIIAHRTPSYTPQHNGVSERRNRTLLDMVRSMMSQTTLPKFFWDYALETDAHILNMVPTKKVKKTPYEVWHGQAPKLSYLKVWGCEALVKRDTLTKPDKLEPSLINQEASGSLEDLEIIQEEDTHPSIDTSLNHEDDDLEIDEPQSDIIPIRRSTRTRRPTDREAAYILESSSIQDRFTTVDHAMQDKLRLSKSQGASTPAELKHMPKSSICRRLWVHYVAVRVLCPDVGVTQNKQADSNRNLGILHWTTVKQHSEKKVSQKQRTFYLILDWICVVLNVRCVDWKKCQVKHVLLLHAAELKQSAIANESGITKGSRHSHAKVHMNLREVFIEFCDIKFRKSSHR